MLWLLRSDSLNIYKCMSVSLTGRCLFKTCLDRYRQKGNYHSLWKYFKGGSFQLLVSEYITNSLRLCQHLINTQLRKDFLTISRTEGFLLTILECTITFLSYLQEKATKLGLQSKTKHPFVSQVTWLVYNPPDP